MRRNIAILSIIGGIFSLIPDMSMWTFLGKYLSNSLTEEAFLNSVNFQLERLTTKGFDTTPEALGRLRATYLMLSALDVVALIGAGLYFIKNPMGLKLYVPAQVVYVIVPLVMVGFHFNNIRALSWGDPLLMLSFVAAFIYFNNKTE